ncbi:MAG: ATP-binding protein [Vicinamibacterales bacterium]
MRDRHGQIVAFAGIAHDVTETRRFESELRQLAKTEAVGRLAGGLAHDFNNMLTVIDGYSELLLMKLPSDSPDRPLITEIHRAGERAAELAMQLMVFSRKSMVEPQVLDLSEVVGADIEMLTRVIGDDVTIETQLAPGLGNVMADRPQLEQVLVNLVLNARDAMPDGGRITIGTTAVTVDASHAAGPQGLAPGEYVVLSVADTGHGMDKATLARIFEPFFTTKGSGRGTGLGLAMLQTFVMQSGGHVDVASEPGQGSTFRVFLPTVALPVAAPQGQPPGDAIPGTESILVVEDDDAVRIYTEAVLKAAGYDVVTAANGADALAVARTCEPPARPPHLRRRHARHWWQRAGRAVPRPAAEAKVLFTSGYTPPEAVSRRGLTIPPSQFLQKPHCRRRLAGRSGR